MLKSKQNILVSTLLVFIMCASMAVLFYSKQAHAEGFGLSEWSARGVGLAGGMVARADDASALAYNAAGITQLPGTNFMFGGATVTPYGQIKGRRADGSTVTNDMSIVSWMPAHGYMSYQLNDNVWLGFALFSRFGLGNGYDADWFGRFNAVQIGLQAVSAVPTVAYKFNDMFSASIGIEVMYMMMNQENRIPDVSAGLANYRENTLRLEGTGLGFGVHLGLHARLNEQWSAGLTYKSQVRQNINGKGKFDYQGNNVGVGINMLNSDISGTMQLPDSVAFAVAYSPTEDLSIEVGTVWTRWSTYKSLDIHFDAPSGANLVSRKDWKDGWNFNASVEYRALDWLTLRAGYTHETSVVSLEYAEYALPVNGRNSLNLGLGFNWEAWALDLAYVHMWNKSIDYSKSIAAGVPSIGVPAIPGGDITSSKSQNLHTDIFMVSLSYTF